MSDEDEAGYVIGPINLPVEALKEAAGTPHRATERFIKEIWADTAVRSLIEVLARDGFHPDRPWDEADEVILKRNGDGGPACPDCGDEMQIAVSGLAGPGDGLTAIGECRECPGVWAETDDHQLERYRPDASS